MDLVSVEPNSISNLIGLDLVHPTDQLPTPSPAPSADQSELQTADQTLPPQQSEQSQSATPSGSPSASRKRAGRASTGGGAKRPRPSQGANTVQVEPILNFLQIPLPHHELIHRSGTNQDPHLIRIKTGVSDGTDAVCPALGVANSNRDTLHNSTETDQLNWRTRIGKAIAAIFKWPGYESQVYVLEAFPERYHLFDNIKYDNSRNDLYLYGSSTAGAKFRSGNEFSPHLAWLLRNGPGVDLEKCACKNCTGTKSQKDINAQQGIPQSTASYLGKRAGETKLNQQLKQPRKDGRTSPPPTYLGSYTNKHRDEDLAQDAAPYRHGEMVWAKLPKPLVHSTRGADMEITHWPGLVSTREVKIKSVLAGGLPRAGEPPKFVSVQRCVYNIQLLAVDDMIKVEEVDVLPWLGLNPTAPTAADFQLKDSSSLVYDGKNIRSPALSDFKGDSKLAMTAYALAIHNAAHVVLKFALTDPYKPEEGHIIRQPELELNQADSDYIEQQGKGTHFQSVWWGAEQIHSEELVRIVVRPHQIDQETTLPLSSDIEGRGFLFKLSAIFRAPAAEGKVPAIKVAGSLVELVKLGEGERPPKAEEEVGDGPTINLPKPPSGYRFRQVTRKDSEVHIDLEYVAGRYYSLPRELDDDAIRVEAARRSFIATKEEADANESAGEVVDVALTSDQLALVLAGVLPGWHKCIHASTWCADRISMVIKAENQSNDEMKNWFESNAGSN